MAKAPRRGDRLQIRASEYSDLLQMRDEWLREKGGGSSLRSRFGDPNVRSVLNDTGADLAKGEIIAQVSTVNWEPTKSFLPLKGDVTNSSTETDVNYGIALEPIRDGRSGPVAFGGVHWAKVDFQTTGTETFAKPVSGATALDSDATSGPFKILERTGATTGVQFALVRFLSPSPSGTESRLFKAPSGGIPARVGMTPGSATCTHCKLDSGEIVTIPATTFTVYNWVTAITNAEGERLGIADVDEFGTWWVEANDCGDEGSV